MQSEDSSSEDSWSNRGGETEDQEFFKEHDDIYFGHSTKGYSEEEVWSDDSKEKGFLGDGTHAKSKTVVQLRQEDFIENHATFDEVVEQAKYK